MVPYLKAGSKVKVPNYTLEFLQSTLEEERREFENILKEKNNLIEKKEKEVRAEFSTIQYKQSCLLMLDFGVAFR